jgi:hypothetical protein
LYIQCESKLLVKNFINNVAVQSEFILCMQRMRAFASPQILHGITLKVIEKVHLMPGGIGKEQPIYRNYLVIPLDRIKQEEIEIKFKETMEALRYLNSKELKQRVMDTFFPLKSSNGKDFKGKSIIGVFLLSYSLNWLELEKLGSNELYERLVTVMDILKPCYDELVKMGE